MIKQAHVFYPNLRYQTGLCMVPGYVATETTASLIPKQETWNETGLQLLA